MRLINKTVAGAVLLSSMSLSAIAQQIPNGGFEGEWVDCTPWTSLGNTSVVTQKINDVEETGRQPQSWCISDVIGMKLNSSPMGATIVGFKETGYKNTETAVRLTNSPNPYMAAQIVPAYITLGTSWSTAVPKIGAGFKITVTKSDGGSFEGKSFTNRPSGIEFMYKRSRGTAKPDEKSTVVAYLWKGHWYQDVPGDITMGTPKDAKMTDRDRCVLEMSMDDCQGGEVTKTDDAELIAKINQDITENAEEWTKFSADFEYLSDATPENINVIIASGDYFGGADAVGKDNTLIVDDVKLFYNYSGNLNIICTDLGLNEKSKATIKIIPDGNGKCTFMLPDFTLGEGDGAMKLGDIVVNDVEMTENNGIYNYVGEAKDLSLLEGGISADVKISGVTQGDRASMKIDVLWTNSFINPTDGTPINVTFATDILPDEPASEIVGINIDNSNAPVEYFNLQGVRVDGENLTPGIYVRRQGNATSKILVK